MKPLSALGDLVSKCFNDLKAKYGERGVPDEEITNALKRLSQIAKDPAKYAERAAKIIEDNAIRRQRQIAEFTRNRIKRDEFKAFADQEIFKQDGKVTADGRVKALLAWMEGAPFKVENGNTSPASRGRATFSNITIWLNSKLDEQKLHEYWKNSGNSLEVKREMYSVIKGGKQSVTGSQEAFELAKILVGVNKKLYTTLKAAGSSINELSDFIMPLTHSARKIHAQGFNAWVAKVDPLLDVDRTFGPAATPQYRNEFLREVYGDVVSGKVRPENINATLGTVNLDKKVSKSRSLHFKGPDELHAYTSEFADKDLSLAVLDSIQKISHQAAAIERFGSNPEANFRRMIEEMRDEFRTADPKESQAFERGIRAAKESFDTLIGRATSSGSGLGAKIYYGAKTWAYAKLLGKVAISSIPDWAISTGITSKLGQRSYFHQAGVLATDFIRQLPASNQKEVAKRTSVLIEDYAKYYIDRISGDADAIAQGRSIGMATKLSQGLHKLSLSHLQMDAAKTAIALDTERALGKVADLNYKSLPNDVMANLQRFGIDEPKWELIRQTKGENGINTSGIDLLTDDQLNAVIKKYGLTDKARMVKGEFPPLDPSLFRRTLEIDVANMFSDIADAGVPTPGTRTQRRLHRGTHIDTPQGLALRLVTTFFSYPLTALDSWTRIGSSSIDNAATNWHQALRMGGANPMITTTVSMMGLGAVALTLNELSEGKTPPDFSKPEVMIDVMQKSGALFLMGDFLLGQHALHGKDIGDKLQGPLLGEAIDAYSILDNLKAAAITGKKSYVSKAYKDWVKLGYRQIPNLLWTKHAMDQLIGFQIMELSSPGFLKRRKKRMKERGQEFLLPP
jgi:hypothetical protein